MPRYDSPYDPSMMPKNLEHIVYEKKGHVAYVRINRPEVRNALHSYAYAEMRACWRDMNIDPDVYCGIFTGTGEAFCAGRDVKFLAKHQAEGKRTPHEDPTNPMFHWGGGGMPSDAKLDKPLICALNGFAVGVGLSLFLECQLRVMAEDTWIGDLHTLVGRLGAPHKLFGKLPQAVCAYLTLANGRLNAQECLQYGIVNRVVKKEDVLAEAEKIAEMVCRGAPLATQAAVRLFRMSSSPTEELNAYARHLDQETAESEDGAEGPRAFKEKRKPAWKSR